MRILVLSQYYPPEAVPIPGEVAQGLADRGHIVGVLTGFPNYPSGEVFEGYRQRWLGREQQGRVRIIRVPLFADHSQRAVRRALNYASFALSSATAFRYARRADVVYVYATQLTAAFAPWLWSFCGGPPYVLHIQDLWPDSVVGSSLTKGGRFTAAAGRLISTWARSVYRRAAGVVAIAPTMVSVLRERGASCAELVYNWGDRPETLTVEPGDGRVTRIVYAGNLGEMQDLEVAVRAAHAAADAGVMLSLVGAGVVRPALESLVAELQCTNVVLADPVPRHLMRSIYAATDFGLVSLKDLPFFRATIPSKLQGLLAYGVPVITTVQGDVRAFVEREGAGLTADAGDVASLEEAFRRAAALSVLARSQMRRKAEAAYAAHFERKEGVSRLERVLYRSAGRDGEKR